MSSVAIVGLGAWSAFGQGHGRLWDGITSGADGLTPVTSWWDKLPDGLLAATLPTHQRRQLMLLYPEVDPGFTAALEAAREAIEHAGITPHAGDLRWALLLGNGNGTLIKSEQYRAEPSQNVAARLRRVRQVSVAEFADELATALGITGPQLTVSTACASSTHAIGLGRELLLAGLVDVVLAGGVDLLHRNVIEGFQTVGAMAATRCAPFSEPPGMTVGEGAGFIVLARPSSPSCPPPLAHLLGLGMACDAYHATASDPSGDGMARSMRGALKDAGVSAAEVGCYNAHGTGTLSNDTAETMALNTVFGRDLPVAANKGQLGHAQGAAGALETIVAIRGLEEQIVPAVPGTATPRKLAPAGLVCGRSRPQTHDLVVKQGAAFGGANVALVLGRQPVANPGLEREVFVTGYGTVGPFEDPQRQLTPIRPRGRCRDLDTAAQLLATAVQRTQETARWQTLRDEVGLFVGVSGFPNREEEYYRRESTGEDTTRRSASEFTRSVRNAPAGAVARQFDLRGPDCTLAEGPGAGMLAALLATAMLSRRAEPRRMLAAGLDLPGELSAVQQDLSQPGESPPRAGSACLALSAGCTDGPLARIAGIGLAGPEQLARAIEQARGEMPPDGVFSGSMFASTADTELRALRAVFGAAGVPLPRRSHTEAGTCETSQSIRAIITAIEALRGGVRQALVIAVSHTGSSLAMRLTAP